MKELLMARLEQLNAELDSYPIGSQERESLIKEIKIVGDLLCDYERNALDEEKVEIDRDKIELERDKFTQDQAEKIVENANESDQKKWNRGIDIGKMAIGVGKILLGLVAITYEVHQHINGKANWAAIGQVFRGE